MGLLAMAATTATSKPYYKEYLREFDREFLTTDAYCWDVIDRKVQTREVVSEAGINTFIEHPDKGDPPAWWSSLLQTWGTSQWLQSAFVMFKRRQIHMLWWTPMLDNCPMVHNLPFSVTIHVLKLKLLNGYKDLCNKYVGLIAKHEGRDHSPVTGLLVTAMCQALIGFIRLG